MSMQSLPSTRTWILANRDLCIEALRIYLGFALFLKGLNFIYAASEVSESFTRSVDFPFSTYAMIHVVGLAHICGGALLALGLLTRVAALIQLPVVFGAILFVTAKQGLFSMEQTLEFTMLVFFLLVLFLVYGSGRLSVDFMLARRREVSND
jgi:putative oxidoreductase